MTIRAHLDRTIPHQNGTGEACTCQATLVPADDHSTEIVVTNMTLDASLVGSSLFLTILNSDSTISGGSVSYYVLDTTAL